MKLHNKLFLEWACKYLEKESQWLSANQLKGLYLSSTEGTGGNKKYIGTSTSLASALRADSRIVSAKEKGITVYQLKEKTSQGLIDGHKY